MPASESETKKPEEVKPKWIAFGESVEANAEEETKSETVIKKEHEYEDKSEEASVVPATISQESVTIKLEEKEASFIKNEPKTKKEKVIAFKKRKNDCINLRERLDDDN